jgi:tRNA pseudouridine38-40 synthase
MTWWAALQRRQAAQIFRGTHDFTQFANTNTAGMNPRKTLTRFEVLEVRPNLLQLQVEGSGFLYRMVRHMVSHLYLIEDRSQASL